jgi:hypothetical protein
MSLPHRFRAGEQLTESKLQSITDAISRVVGVDGGSTEEDFIGGVGATAHASVKLARFELGPEWIKGEGPNPPYWEPHDYYKCPGSRLVYYYILEGEYRKKAGNLELDETVWYIVKDKSHPTSTSGDWVWCVFNVLSGKWEVIPLEGGLVEGCLAEDHPGRGVVFEIYTGTWVPENNGWYYEQSSSGYQGGESSSGLCTPTGDLKKAVDWRYGMTYPTAGARGLFAKRLGYCEGEYVTMYEVVSLDCESPGECCDPEVAEGCEEE